MTRHATALALGLTALAFTVGFAIGRATLADALDACRDGIAEMMRQP